MTILSSALPILLFMISSSQLLQSSEAFTPTRATPFHPRVAATTTSLMAQTNPDHSVFLTPETAMKCIQVAQGTPLYAYSLPKLKENADACLAFPNAYGLTVRYAMKACPNGTILKYFNQRGIHIDASSGFEVRRAIANGVPPENISLSSQELPQDFDQLVDLGVKINAWYVGLVCIEYLGVNDFIFIIAIETFFTARYLNWSDLENIIRVKGRKLVFESILVSDPVDSQLLLLASLKQM